MKKYLLLMLLTPFTYADMDTVCLIYFPEGWVSTLEVEGKIRTRRCERNNVLEINLGKESEYTKETLLKLSNKFCRFDRNRSIERKTLSCILYSTRARNETSL